MIWIHKSIQTMYSYECKDMWCLFLSDADFCVEELGCPLVIWSWWFLGVIEGVTFTLWQFFLSPIFWWDSRTKWMKVDWFFSNKKKAYNSYLRSTIQLWIADALSCSVIASLSFIGYTFMGVNWAEWLDLCCCNQLVILVAVLTLFIHLF